MAGRTNRDSGNMENGKTRWTDDVYEVCEPSISQGWFPHTGVVILIFYNKRPSDS